jgi:hypothetical protein
VFVGLFFFFLVGGERSHRRVVCCTTSGAGGVSEFRCSAGVEGGSLVLMVDSGVGVGLVLVLGTWLGDRLGGTM